MIANDKNSKDEESIFNAALELDGPTARAAYLKKACGNDQNLLNRLQALLELNEIEDGFLENPPTIFDEPTGTHIPSEVLGTVIGRYKLLEQIGEGGMATVFMAEQIRPFQRKVALKIIKVGMDTKSVIARFEAERQALAMMDHPNIAKVLDAGTTETGRPYFVMELVKGIPITDYCDKNMLNNQERLDLFIQVCNAVQHAHQKGIIHRDIKPSNVMVTLHDDSAVPKVIDFGIARATNQKLTEKTLFTQYAQIIGTPVYMSPEQAQFSDLDIDTRTDIYSLGTLLYELLTGTTPLDCEELRCKGYAEMQRIIQEEDPPKPSTKLSTMGEALTGIAAYRKSSPDSLRKSVKGDLDWIVMKCLEKDRTRRFESAYGLAADIKRHLDNEPIVARPPSAAYRLQKAWRRNKVVYTAAAAVAIVLLVGTGISLWQARIANAARKIAVQEELNALQHVYNSDMSLAFRALEDNIFGRVRESVRQHVPEHGEPDFRGWEWRYAWAQSQSDAVLTWDTPEGMDEVFALRISPDQRYLVSSEFRPGPTSNKDQIRRLWNFQTREELEHVHLPIGQPRGFVFSNSGSHLALHHRNENNAHEIQIHDTATWELETVIPVETEIRSLSFSPDDKTLAAIGPLAAVLWDWRRQAIIHQWSVHSRGAPLDVAFFPDGRRLAIGGMNELKIVDVATGGIEYRQPAPDDGTILAISPDSRYVALGSGYKICEIGVLNVASWAQEPPLLGHSGWVTSLTFSQDGKQLISSSADNTIRVWDMNRRVTTRVLKGHQSEVYFVSLASDETRAISAGKDKKILEWDLNVPLSPFREHLLTEPVRQVVFSADSRSFYTIDKNGSISIWNAKTFKKQHSISPELGPDSSIILSPDGDRLIAGTGTGQLWILDANDLQVVAHRSTQSGLILPVGFSADGTFLVVLESGNKISLWNVDTWQLRSRVETRLNIEYYIKNYCVIPQHSDMFLCPSGGDLVWWDLAQSKELARIRIHSRRSGYIAVSPIEPLLASASRSDFINLWNWQTRQPAGSLRGSSSLHSVAFSPDGRRLVSGGNGKGALMLWDVSAKHEIARFGTRVSPILHSVQFSPDGNMICAVDIDGTASFWQAPSFEKINAIETEQRKQKEK
ncbi:MAG: protein kinase domain-containing protein [Planctomycetota bacterium]|jgi:serine/threonine protein kinase/WD40 repeat protein